jgi:SprB repeat
VQIPSSNYNGALRNLVTSTGNDPAPDPDNNIENDDNGSNLAGYGVISQPVTIGAIAEPLDLGYTNPSVDFGFYPTPPCGLTATAVGTNVSCNGASNGTATATAVGNVGAVTYIWNNGATTAAITGLVAGTYTITVTESVSCSAIASYVVTQPTVLTTTCTKTDATTIGGNQGTATATPSGGTSPYTYLWSNGNTTAAPTGLVAGTYTVTVTDANSCTTTCASTVVDPSCTQPTVGTPSPTPATCTAGTPNSDAKIDIAGIANGDKYAYGTTGAGGFAYATATAFAGATISITGLPNPATATTYTIRIYNGANTCVRDITVVLQPQTCATPCGTPNCLPATVARH